MSLSPLMTVERCQYMPHENFEGVLPAIHTIEKFAGRLPEGDVEGHIRRSAHELTVAGTMKYPFPE